MPTYGLTHISVGVKDPDRSFAFYRELFGVQEVYREESVIQAQTPGCRDVLVFERREPVGPRGGIEHFGFRLTDPADIDEAVRTAESAGGKLLRRGEFAPGLPYAYVADPDGYEIEIWFE